MRTPTTILVFVLGLSACAADPAPCPRSPAEILSRHRLGRLAIDAPPAAAAAQHRRWGGVCFGRALDLALAAFLSAHDDPEAPLAIAAAVPAEAPCPQRDPTARLRCYLGTGATLGLVTGADPDIVAEAWVLVLEIPALSDHLFWAEVDRASGRVAVHGVN